MQIEFFAVAVFDIQYTERVKIKNFGFRKF